MSIIEIVRVGLLDVRGGPDVEVLGVDYGRRNERGE